MNGGGKCKNHIGRIGLGGLLRGEDGIKGFGAGGWRYSGRDGDRSMNGEE
jgi:hypothetical protein